MRSVQFKVLCALRNAVLGLLLVLGATQSATADISINVAKSIIVIGDSLADGLHAGLHGLLKKDNFNKQLYKKTKVSSGLVRNIKIDWQATIRQIAATRKYDIAIVTIGANDLMGFRTKKGPVYYKSPRWDVLYGERVMEVVKTLRAGGMTVYWVGLPITRRDRHQKAYARLNRVFQKAATAAGASYIDTWNPLSANGRYTSVGRNVRGQLTTLRATDGVHFTPAGYAAYANLVLKSIPKHVLFSSTGAVIERHPEVVWRGKHAAIHPPKATETGKVAPVRKKRTNRKKRRLSRKASLRKNNWRRKMGR